MDNKSTSMLIAAFVMIIIGISLIGVIATQEQQVTTKTSSTSEVHKVLSPITSGRNTTAFNETIRYTITNAPTGWKVTDCPITNFVLKNSTGATLTETTDYVLTASSGIYTLVDSATLLEALPPTGTNNTYASYNYCPDNYINSTFGRTMLDLVPGFFALALLGIGIGLLYGVLRKENLLGM